MDRAPFAIGEQVYDQHDDDPDTAVVTTTPEIPAEDWDIPHLERTVAEDNPDYPDASEDEDADESEDTEQSEDTTESESDSDTEPEDESDPEPPAEVRDLKETLADRGLATEIEGDGQTVTAEKLGVTYRVQPGEVIDGDGPHRDKIEEIADEA
jgi:hypothetical protein